MAEGICDSICCHSDQQVLLDNIYQDSHKLYCDSYCDTKMLKRQLLSARGLKKVVISEAQALGYTLSRAIVFSVAQQMLKEQGTHSGEESNLGIGPNPQSKKKHRRRCLLHCEHGGQSNQGSGDRPLRPRCTGQAHSRASSCEVPPKPPGGRVFKRVRRYRVVTRKKRPGCPRVVTAGASSRVKNSDQEGTCSFAACQDTSRRVTALRAEAQRTRPDGAVMRCVCMKQTPAFPHGGGQITAVHGQQRQACRSIAYRDTW
jgi:hypothetical protein